MTKNIYSVGQVNAYIKNMFAQDFMMNRIYVRGEVSNCKYHSSGHIYFTLKDGSGVLQGVMFSQYRKTGLSFSMKEGDNVIVLGSIRVYERDGKYQLYAQEVLLEGAGLLYRRFEALKRELEEMGMFAPEYKQPIPKYSARIGIVTAPTGAAIRDIQNISRRRNPYVQLILYPAQVQGDGAAASIVQGIYALEQMGVDVIIVGRGGGSIEDLWAFNEEIVARAIFDCTVPIISAVGHETDTTIADYVADLRAPTPSAAAELAVFDFRSLTEQLDQIRMRLNRQMCCRLDELTAQMRQYQLRLQIFHPRNQWLEKQQYVADAEERLAMLMEQRLQQARHRLELYAEKLDSRSPLKKLKDGYAFLSEETGKRISSVHQLRVNDRILAHVEDGTFTAVIQEISPADILSGE